MIDLEYIFSVTSSASGSDYADNLKRKCDKFERYAPAVTSISIAITSINGLHSISLRRYPFVMSGTVLLLVHGLSGILADTTVPEAKRNYITRIYYNTLRFVVYPIIPMALVNTELLIEQDSMLTSLPLMVTMMPFICHPEFALDILHTCMLANIGLFLHGGMQKSWQHQLLAYFIFDYLTTLLMSSWKIPHSFSRTRNLINIKISFLNFITILALQN